MIPPPKSQRLRIAINRNQAHAIRESKQQGEACKNHNHNNGTEMPCVGDGGGSRGTNYGLDLLLCDGDGSGVNGEGDDGHKL